MRINGSNIDSFSFLLFLNLHFLHLYLLFYLDNFFLFIFIFLLFDNLLKLLVLSLLLVYGDYFIEALMLLYSVVSQRLGDITQIDENILLYLHPYEHFNVPFFGIRLIAADDGQDLIGNGLQYFGRLVLNQIMDSSQIVFVDDFVLLGFWTIINGLVESFCEKVAALVFPCFCRFVTLYLFLRSFAPRCVLPHRLSVYHTDQALDVFCWLFSHL